MFNTRKLCAAAALALCAFAPPAAMAKQVLYLSTAEWNGHGYDTTDPKTSKITYADPDAKATCPNYTGSGGRGFINKSKDYFRKAPGVALSDYAGTLSTDFQIGKITTPEGLSEFPKKDEWDNAKKEFSNLTAGDVVVVQTAYHLMDPVKAAFIAEQIKTRSDLTFILLLDACDGCSYDSRDNDGDGKCDGVAKSTANLDAIMDPAINMPLGWGVHSAKLGNSMQWTAELDPYGRSAYAASVTAPVDATIAGGKGGLMGHTSGTMQCVPQQNVLFPAPTGNAQGGGYRFSSNGYISGRYCDAADERNNPSCTFSKATAAKWPELNASSAFGLIVPFWQSNNGEGACIYLAQDNNLFDDGRCKNAPGPYQCDALASMFLSLPEGACTVTPQHGSSLGACVNMGADGRCVLTDAPPPPKPLQDMTIRERLDYDATLAVLGTRGADGNLVCKAKVWCSSIEEDRAAYCKDGEDPSTHCCKAKPICPRPPSAPTTGWPALLGLGALLPLLAARRRRRK